MKEIKEHPWYLKDLPHYLQELSIINSRKSVDIDYDIVKKLFTVNFLHFNGILVKYKLVR